MEWIFYEEDEEKAKQQGRKQSSGNLIVEFDLPNNKMYEIAVLHGSINVGAILHPESINLYDISNDQKNEFLQYLYPNQMLMNLTQKGI